MRKVFIALTLACAEPSATREAELVSVFSRADAVLIRTRPALVAGKLARMSESLIDYYRGTPPLYLHDWRTSDVSRSQFAVADPLVWGTADPHPENFGGLIAADGTVAIEPNDFDGADMVPYLFDLRRLLVGLVVAAHGSNADDPTARALAIDAARTIVRRAAYAYAMAVRDFAEGAPRVALTDAGPDVILADVLRRSVRDRGLEIAQLTVPNEERLVRGVLDPTQPYQMLVDLPAFAQGALPGVLDSYRSTLLNAPDATFFTVLDSARELGSGVMSYARLRALVLVRGPTDAKDDDVILEVKEIADSNSPGWMPPGVFFDTVQSRVTQTSRAMWGREGAAPLWGTSSWVGFPVQVRLESEGQKTVRVSRMEGARGTPDALAMLGESLARLVARMHATPSRLSDAPAERLWARISADANGFADEQADVCVSYGDIVVADQPLFVSELARLGPRLGIPFDAADLPQPDLQALYGSP